MPDLRDLHDAFAHLEQEIPNGYRSPVVADRVAHLLGQADGPVRSHRRVSIATVLLAAAAVAAIAVAAVSLSSRSSGNPQVGNHPTASHSVTGTPSPHHATASTHSSSQHSVPNPGHAMPASRSALVAYVRDAPSVKANGYQQAEPGPGQAMRPTPGVAEFNTPSGNITCAMFEGTTGAGASVTCTARQSSFHVPPKPASCHNNWAGYFGFIAGGRVSVGACVGGPEFGPTTRSLPYGSALELSGIRCRSESGFLACADLTTGHGFAVNRDTLQTY